MLKLKNLTKIYQGKQGEVKAIDHLSWDVAKGDFVALIGPSGCGKSTLLLMLGGMLAPTEGEILIDGQSLYDLRPNDLAKLRRTKIGFVFQTFNLIPYLTALQNVQVPLLLSGLDEKGQQARAVQLLERVGLQDRMEHKPSELSVGQQQRVALARTLANDPMIILADEPTGNLDPEMSEQVICFLQELNREGKTIVMVTHDHKRSSQAKHTLSLTEGKILNTKNP